MRRLFIPLLSFMSAVWLSVLPMGAAAQPTLPPNASVVAAGLVNPRGMVFASDGSLIVTEAGSPPEGFVSPGAPPTPTFRPGTNLTGRVLRIDLASGERTVLAD